MKSDLQDAVTAVRLSRAVIRNIKENLFWAFFYNVIGIPLAAGVWYPLFEVKLNPMFGAAAMSLSSIFVVGNALRLKRFKSGFKATDASGDGQHGEAVANAESMKAPVSAESMKAPAAAESMKTPVTTENMKASAENMHVSQNCGFCGEGTAALGGGECEFKNDDIPGGAHGERKEMNMTKKMLIEGMMCGHCTGRVQKALEALEGVKAVTMSLEEKSALVELGAEVADEVLTGAVTEAGYEVKDITNEK